MITEKDIREAVTTVTESLSVNRWAVGVEYRETWEGDPPWIVRIAYQMASSRKGYTNTLEGYGDTPRAAAEDAMGAYRRAVERGDVGV